ncbi:VOC family protein [Nakamurella sp. PAMC28650]|uniref:VOC family protein n=1 Tax=Nakamurella sp. PAMC28650 TaxID=2762325 RepID=UPI00164DEA0C|nr:VOC family protein [Nakamurella sp. PAMC28650]QNK81790.1 VOC family protein [Nakamurella sp. PAMC28650]
MELTLDVIGLVGSDMAAGLAFYRRLGPAIPAEADISPHVEFGLPGGIRLCWDTEEVMASFDPEFAAVTKAGRSSIGFAAASPAEIDSGYADLVAAGHHGHLAPWDAFWGQRYAVGHDPDGVTVDLFAQLPQ